jgi:hypothetical protein
MASVRIPFRRALLLAIVALFASAGAGQAQPFDTWLDHDGTGTGLIEISHHPSLNPTAAFTFEAWVQVVTADAGDCRSIAGKNFQQTWWIGVCGTTLRSYLKGLGSNRDGGVVPPGQWTHVAVVFDGTRRLHYVNGEVVGDFPEAGPLPTNTAPMRIASDVSWPFPPDGGIDEVRLWNVARSLRTGPPGAAEDVAQVASCSTDSSGVFWFSDANSWEVMVRVLDGCHLNDHWWVFWVTTTDLFYRLEVRDVVRGEQKIYFTESGLWSPAMPA